MNIFKTAYKTGEKLGEKLGGKLKERLENGSKVGAEPETDLSKQLRNIEEMIELNNLDVGAFVPAIQELVDKAPKVPEGYSNWFFSPFLLHEIGEKSPDSALNIAKGLLDKGYAGVDMFDLISKKYDNRHITWDAFLYGDVSSREADSSYFGELLNYAQKINDSDHVEKIFPLYTDALKQKGDYLKGASKDVRLEELQKMTPDTVPELNPKYVSPEQGQAVDKSLGVFMGVLMYEGSKDTPLGKKSLEVLEEFAKKGYPSAQETLGAIALNKGDKKALNHWAKQVEKNPFSTEEQKKNAHDDVKDTQAFVAQSQARGGR